MFKKRSLQKRQPKPDITSLFEGRFFYGTPGVLIREPIMNGFIHAGITSHSPIHKSAYIAEWVLHL
jgi:hypothetical protein